MERYTRKIKGRTFTADELLMNNEGIANETRMELLFDAADGIPMLQAIKYLEHGAEMAERLKWAKNLLISAGMHRKEKHAIEALLQALESEV